MNKLGFTVMDELEKATIELDHKKVSWIDKHLVIDLQQKSEILYETITRLEDEEQETALESAIEFLNEVQPIIKKINQTTGV